MGKSWQIGRIQGIPILVHWSLGIFFLLLIYIAHYHQFSPSQIGWLLAFIISLFFCIVLHELGHALTAKRYNVLTKDIILSPIGGLARLEKIPDKPWEEFWIALNGPMVNIGIALLLSGYFFLSDTLIFPDLSKNSLATDIPTFLQFLFWMNLMVFIFNLIPAFPMDGGRILRALLRTKFSRLTSTKVAVYIGRVFAVAFIILAVWQYQFVLGIIGLFIFLMAGQELNHVKLTTLLSSFKLQDLNNFNIAQVQHDTTFQKVKELIKEQKLKNFLVFNSEAQIIGTLPQWFIKSALKEPEKYTEVSDLMSINYRLIDDQTLLEDVFNLMQNDGLAIIGVTRNNELIGSVDRDQLSQYISSNTIH